MAISNVAENLQTVNFISNFSKSPNPCSKSLSFLSFGSKYKTQNTQISVSSNKRKSFTVSASAATTEKPSTVPEIVLLLHDGFAELDAVLVFCYVVFLYWSCESFNFLKESRPHTKGVVSHLMDWAIDQSYGSIEKLIAKLNVEGAAV
ncbi:hypothetical protein L1987_43711 [Smallanthus sonchifolius]|uniref:Uncharacterized protein n=1 Tax=Smallanthus sonchifolius TaxID=185202 RepID=A0ACB9GMD7_9ASTR|nr:hypothetical protein L1987_43711 [Smallanthus sonchifolius]